MRNVHKIRSPRCWSREEHFTQELATLACILAPPIQIPTKPILLRRSILTEQPFAMEPLLASPAGESCMHWSVFWVPRHYPHWHPSSVIRCLWTIVYGHKKHAKVGQRVHIWTYRRPWQTVFWSAFGIGRNNYKSGAITRNAWRSVYDSSWAMWTDPWSQ